MGFDELHYRFWARPGDQHRSCPSAQSIVAHMVSDSNKKASLGDGIQVDTSMFDPIAVAPAKRKKIMWLDVVWRDGAPWRQETWGYEDCICQDPNAKAGFLCPDAPPRPETRSPRPPPSNVATCLCEDPNAKAGFLCPDHLAKKRKLQENGHVVTGQAQTPGNYGSQGAAALVNLNRTAEEGLKAAIQAAKPKDDGAVQPGMRVRIEGLMRRKDLNGATGTVRTWVPGLRGAPGRWAVHCDGELGCVLFELKEDNLLVLGPGPQQRNTRPIVYLAPCPDSVVPREIVLDGPTVDQSAAPWEREFQ